MASANPPRPKWLLERRWGTGHRPLTRVIIAQASRRERMSWLGSLLEAFGAVSRSEGPREGGELASFDVTLALHRLCVDLTRRCPDLVHIDPERILVTVTPSRSRSRYGLQARVTPMRFRDGELTRRHRGHTYQVQRYFVDGRELLYLVTFCVPRFLDLSFEQKLITVIHELYHIGERFDGDIRRHAGRYEAHSHSKKEYDRRMAELAGAYLRTDPSPELYEWMKLSTQELAAHHGRVTGVTIPRPKLIPVMTPAVERNPPSTSSESSVPPRTRP